jgi:hypothetical protein
MLTTEQIKDVCPAVFGTHDWHWFETPILQTFVEKTAEPLFDTYMRMCKRCSMIQHFDVPSSSNE